MATWAIGDIHGCFDTLERLWRRLDFDRQRDRLWLVGDLVNRGPKSLEVLRWARERSRRLGERMVVVLGNHDLHALARARGLAAAKPRDTLGALLEAPDRDRLLDWLRRRPFLHRDGDFVLVHAGFRPGWSIDRATSWARRLEEQLTGQGAARLLAPGNGSGDEGSRASHRAVHAFTLLRTCRRDGEPCSFNGPPGEAPEGCHPWHRLWRPERRGVTVVCGHWAAQGLEIGAGMLALDTACVWGGALTALRLEDLELVQQPCLERLLRH